MQARNFKFASMGIILLYVSPIFIFGEDSLVQIHDYLDGRHTHLKTLADSGLIFDTTGAEIPNLLNGIPRSAMGSEFNVYLWLFYFLGPFWAFAFNKLLIHVIAFWGMHRLLTTHFIDKKNEWVAILAALGFGLLPFLPSIGLTVAGQPLMLDAFLNVRKREGKWQDWLILILMPLYISLVHFLFFPVFIGLIWLYDLIQRKDPNPRFLGAIFIVSLLCLLVEYRYFLLLVLNSGYESQRLEIAPPHPPPFSLFAIHEALKEGLIHFAKGYWHAKPLQALAIFPAALLGLFIIFENRLKDRRLMVLLFITMSIALFFGIWRSPAIWPLKSMVMEVIGTYRLYYIYYLNPLFWFLIFALSLTLIAEHTRIGKMVVFILVGLQVLFSFYYHDEIQLRHRKPTYHQFYASNMFTNIAEYIGKDQSQYRVVSIGIHPSIAIFNGFYTMDGYHPAYPLKHKHAFEKVIQGELNKSQQLRDYFNEGSRCYLFAAELIFAEWVYVKERNAVINNLELNIEAFKELGGEYIFSAVKINNFKENQLELLKVFEEEESAWKIFLYRPVPPDTAGLTPS